MSARTPIRGRLAELLAAEAADDIEADERAELERLAVQAPAGEREQLMHAAGLAQLAFLKRDEAAPRALPEALRGRLARQGAAWQAGRQSSTAAPVADLERARRRRDEGRRTPPQPGAVRMERAGIAGLGWYTAAALALAVVMLQLMHAPAPSAVAVASPETRRETLLREAPDALRVTWTASSVPGFESARGDVVWSDARQEGYLQLAGLPANDRSREQYQLWVVDPERDARPVDGGVFDVVADGTAVIPIRVALPVERPKTFAITLEKAGGVVVSDGPMLLVAAVGG